VPYLIGILVADGKVWIIDFEKSRRFAILKDAEDFEYERTEISDMFKALKAGESYY
jgi:predicted Ser/Thr protein kinase